MSSVIKTTTIETNTPSGRETLAGARRQLKAQRAAGVPEVALVNNFDVDQRRFLTTPLKGFSMVQKGAGEAGIYGTLAVQADYGVVPPGKDQAVRPIPGQPVLIYPAAAQTGSFNTSFIRSGGTDPKRYYPIQFLNRGAPFTVSLE